MERITKLSAPDPLAVVVLIGVTGDHAARPQLRAVLDALLALGDRVLLVRGNADRELVERAKGGSSTVLEADPIGLGTAQQLSREHIELLDGLPHPVTVQVDGFRQVRFWHGTPRDDDEAVLVDTRLDRWVEVPTG